MFNPSAIFGFGDNGRVQSAQARDTTERLTSLLLDDEIQVISSLELNQFATLTYHVDASTNGDDLCEVLLQTLANILSKPTVYSTLTLLKSLVVTQWLLLYGADRVIREAVVVGRYVDALQNYNTILLAQQQSGATGLFLRIKGGGVDKGGPVRDKAQRVVQLLSDNEFLRQERQRKADPGSLVPVGNPQKAAFVTDEVRLLALRKRMEQEQNMQTRSNLIKPDGGFGGGYNARDGKNVVGAAHGLEEMIKMAEREKRKFTDGTSQGGPIVDEHGYLAPQFAVVGVTPTTASACSTESANVGDLLSMVEPIPSDASPPDESDLLNFGGTTTTVPPVSNSFDVDDLLGFNSASAVDTVPQPTSGSLLDLPTGSDLLGESDGETRHASTTGVWSTTDLLGSMSINPSQDGAVLSQDTSVPLSTLPNNSLNALGGNAHGTMSASQLHPSQSSSIEKDRFAALDALVSGSVGMATKPATAPNNAFSDLSLIGNLSLKPVVAPPTLQPAASLYPNMSTLQVSASQVPLPWTPGIAADDNDDSNNAFVMGGTMGSGLQPLGPAPAAPPPPPPSWSL